MTQQPVISNRRPTASHCRPDDSMRSPRNRMVLCLGAWPRAAVLERHFQERGWKVHIAESPEAARGLVCKHGPALVVLADENTAAESGWLTSWKLLRDKPGSRVVLVGDLPVIRGKQFAKIVGADDYLPGSETALGIARLMQEAGIC